MGIRKFVRGGRVAAFAATGLLALTVLSAPSANAAPIPNAFSDVTVTHENGTELVNGDTVGRYEILRYTAKWAVPDGSQPGDKIEMSIYGPFEVRTPPLQFNMYAPDNVTVYGSCVVDIANKVQRCTLSEAVRGKKDVHGTTEAWVKLTASEAQINTDVPIVIGLSTITVKPAAGTGPNPRVSDKDCVIGSNGQPWCLVMISSDLYDKKDLTVVEQPGDGLTCKASDARLWGRTSTAWVNLRAFTPSEITESSNGFTVKFADGALLGGTYSMYGVYAGCTGDGRDEYTNNATITAKDVESKTVTDTVKVEGGSGTGTGDPMSPTAVAVECGEYPCDTKSVEKISITAPADSDATGFQVGHKNGDEFIVLETLPINGEEMATFTPKEAGTYDVRTVLPDGKFSESVPVPVKECVAPPCPTPPPPTPTPTPEPPSPTSSPSDVPSTPVSPTPPPTCPPLKDGDKALADCATPAPPVTNKPRLAQTGSNIGWFIGVAALLVGSGTIFTIVRRRSA